MSKGKKILAAIVAGCMALSVASMSAFAAEKAEEPEVAIQTDSYKITLPTQDFIDKYFGGQDGWARLARFVANTVGQIVTGTYANDLYDVLMNAYENGIIIGNPADMTQEEVTMMLDQIYWVYGDNPELVSWIVDCAKMAENLTDATIHSSDPFHQKLAVYYKQWLEKNCDPSYMPDDPDVTEPTGPSETDPDVTVPTDPDVTDPTGPSDTDPAGPDDTDPAGPSDTDPAGPDDTDPAGPDDTDPAGPDDEEPSLDDGNQGDNGDKDGNSNVSTGDVAMIGLGVVLATSAACVAILRKKAK